MCRQWILERQAPRASVPRSRRLRIEGKLPAGTRICAGDDTVDDVDRGYRAGRPGDKTLSRIRRRQGRAVRETSILRDVQRRLVQKRFRLIEAEEEELVPRGCGHVANLVVAAGQCQALPVRATVIRGDECLAPGLAPIRVDHVDALGSLSQNGCADAAKGRSR